MIAAENTIALLTIYCAKRFHLPAAVLPKLTVIAPLADNMLDIALPEVEVALSRVNVKEFNTE